MKNFRQRQIFILVFLFSFIFATGLAFADSAKIQNSKDSILAIDLIQFEQKALDYSRTYKSASFEMAASESRIDILKSQNYPIVKLDGTYTYVTNVPKMNNVPLSDNHIYSVGPTINYLLYDGGAVKNDIKSANALFESKKMEYDAVKNEIILKMRLAYVDAQLAFEQLHLISESLKLADKQYRDISRRATLGATSFQDVLSAHKEVLRFSLQTKQMQDNLSSKIIDILALTGDENKFDLSFPWAAKLDTNIYLSTSSPSVFVSLESLNDTLNYISKSVSLDKKPKNMRIEALAKKKEALKYALESISSDKKLKIRLSERTSFEYPEEISLDRYIQNAASINVSMNLFDGGKTKNSKIQKQNEINSTIETQKNLETELNRDYIKACNTLGFLKSEQQIAEQGVREMEKVAALVYGSYQAGQIGYLDVENANLKVLEWKVQLATIKAKVAVQLSILSFYES